MILNELLTGTDPVILVLNHGEALATEISRTLESAQKAGVQVMKINVEAQPEYGEQFQVGKHPVMLIWHCGEVLSRRSRPWKHDVEQMVDSAKKLKAPATDAGAAAPMEQDEQTPANDKTVTVTDASFQKLVLESPLPVLVDFWADWCGPCKMVAPILDKLAAEFAGKVRIAKVDVDSNPILSQQFRIQSIPSLMFVKGGKIVGMSAGAAPEPALRDAINQLISLKL